MKSFDPFDLWASDFLGELKISLYRGGRWAVVPLAFAYLLDLLAPEAIRRVMRVQKREFAHVLAMLQETRHALSDTEFVERMEKMRTRNAWGLGFKWYSVNGVYPETMPYITNAPYVMEALVKIPSDSPAKARANKLFADSWYFLEALKVQYEDEDSMALSYAPIEEPNIVVNANSYAAFSYAMHWRHGPKERRKVARRRALKLARWVVKQQYDDGRWYYLANRGAHDMIDGFHSCFVVRNLRKAGKYLPDIVPITERAIENGWRYIKRELFDPKVGLSRRYAVISRPDPFRYDLYDQAEFLGLLVDFNELEAARALVENVHKRFVRKGDWYCRIDKLNRRWGRNFLRWGVVQFWVHEERLQRALGGRN